MENNNDNAPKPVEIDIATVTTPAPKASEPSKVDNALTLMSRIVSTVFSPLLVPTYGMILIFTLTVLQYVTPQAKWLTVMVTLALTGVVPLIVIFLLYKAKIITDTVLNRRKERIYPYAAAFLAYLGCALYLYSVNAPDWVWLFIVGGATALLIVAVVNVWWKISAHAAAMGGLVGLVLFIVRYGLAMDDITWVAMAIVVLAGLVCSTRLILKRHTLLQVGAGFAVGVASVLYCVSFRIPEIVEIW